jgi:phage tail-like protein
VNFRSRAWTGRFLIVAIAAIAVVVVNAQKDPRKDQLPAYYFEVQIAGQQTGFFRSVSGLEMETEVVEFREGGQNSGTIRKLPGVTRVANIQLSRAFTGDRSLYDWFVAPQTTRVNGRIVMFDRQGQRVAAWTFINGFPVKWSGPEFDASKNEVAIETIEIAHEGLTFSEDE